MEKIDDIKRLLEEETERINRPAFIASDPVQFPRQFSDLRDIEIAAFLSAMIAWGNRKMICRDADRLMDIMNREPAVFTKERAFEELDDDRNIHRTFFARDLKYFLRGINLIYSKFSSLDDLGKSLRLYEEAAPAWRLTEEMLKYMREANHGQSNSRCLPTNLDATALKRINMAIRWLVRKDGIVDLGVWDSIPQEKLFIPLDIHVGNVSRNLGLLQRKSNDRKAVEELTTVLRGFDPADPVKYDFALFGIGIGC
ncbi:MAG: TIGR02757 family protein [Muribaculaceae bacterium]|nr:TIGR02757 family protein [Muribaculaceae bacterium]